MSDRQPVSGEPPFPPPAQRYPPSGPAHGGYPPSGYSPPSGYPPGAPNPGSYGQQPGFPSFAAGRRPPPTRSRTPLIIAIAAAGVVMIVLAFGAVLVVTRVGGGDTATGGSDDEASSASAQPAGGETIQAPGLYTVTLPAGFRVTKAPTPPGFLLMASGPGGTVAVSNHFLFIAGGAPVRTQEELESGVMQTDGELIGTVAETQRPNIQNHLAVLYVGADTTRAYVHVTGNQVIRFTCLGDLTPHSQANSKRMCTEVLPSLKVG